MVLIVVIAIAGVAMYWKWGFRKRAVYIGRSESRCFCFKPNGYQEV